jgi:5-methyltetrahydrofolate--homocysteine methyltransferase
VGFFPAFSEGDDIVLPEHAARFIFPRNQERTFNGEPNPCLSDFILPRELFEKEQTSTVAALNPAGRVGIFALSAGFGFREAEEESRKQNDDHEVLLLAGLADLLSEAFSEDVHRRLKNSWGGGIRPVFGYPACPDHRDNETAFRLLDAKNRCGFELTETGMIIPAASLCGLYIAHPDSRYFEAGMIGDDQLNDWARRKGISPGEAEKRMGRF